MKWYNLINESRIANRNILGDMYNIDTFEDEVHVPYHNKTVIQQGFTTQLALRDIKSTDLTKYEVEIINSIGVAFHSVTLAPEGKRNYSVSRIIKKFNNSPSLYTFKTKAGQF